MKMGQNKKKKNNIFQKYQKKFWVGWLKMGM